MIHKMIRLFTFHIASTFLFSLKRRRIYFSISTVIVTTQIGNPASRAAWIVCGHAYLIAKFEKIQIKIKGEKKITQKMEKKI